MNTHFLLAGYILTGLLILIGISIVIYVTIVHFRRIHKTSSRVTEKSPQWREGDVWIEPDGISRVFRDGKIEIIPEKVEDLIQVNGIYMTRNKAKAYLAAIVKKAIEEHDFSEYSFDMHITGTSPSLSAKKDVPVIGVVNWEQTNLPVREESTGVYTFMEVQYREQPDTITASTSEITTVSLKKLWPETLQDLGVYLDTLTRIPISNFVNGKESIPVFPNEIAIWVLDEDIRVIASRVDQKVIFFIDGECFNATDGIPTPRIFQRGHHSKVVSIKNMMTLQQAKELLSRLSKDAIPYPDLKHTHYCWKDPDTNKYKNIVAFETAGDWGIVIEWNFWYGEEARELIEFSSTN